MAIGAILGQTMNPGDGIDLVGRDISIKLSEQEGNGLKFDETGALLSGSGKRNCRFVIGTSTAGWTQQDCDYLCDGVDDQLEINSAIQAVPDNGGEIIILDGTYNITSSINLNKNNIILTGNGSATILKRMWESSTDEGIITITGLNRNSIIRNFSITDYSASVSEQNHGICLKSTSQNIISNIYCFNVFFYGIALFSSKNNIISNNICYRNYNGITLDDSSESNTIISNDCSNNNSNGIAILGASKNNIICGNTSNDNFSHGFYLDSALQNSISSNVAINNITGCYLIGTSSNNTVVGNSFIGDSINASSSTTNNLFSSNNCMGKAVRDSGSNNTSVNNKYN